MALYDPSDTVDVMHPSGGIVTIPTSVARMAGVTPDMIVQRQPQQQSAPVTPSAPVVQASDDEMPAGMAAPSPTPTTADPGPKQFSTMDMQNMSAPNRNGGYGPTDPRTGKGLWSSPPSDDEARKALASNSYLPPLANSPVDKAAQGLNADLAKMTPGGAPGSAQAQETNTPQTAPDTTASLRAGSTADTLNAETSAMDQGAKAGAKAADDSAAYNAAMAHEYEQRNQQWDKIHEQQAAQAQANLNAINAKAAMVDKAIDDYGKTPINRTSDHPILNFLGILMAGAGQGLARDYTGANPAMQQLDKALDAKVQTQMDNLKVQQGRIGMMRDSISQLQQNFTNTNAMFDAQKAGVIQHTINMGDQLASQLKSQQAITNWQTQRAQLQQQMAQLRGAAIDKQHATDLAAAATAEANRRERFKEGLESREANRADAEFDFKKKQYQDQLDLAQKMAAQQGNVALAAKAEDVKDNGVFDPTSGNAVLDEQGQMKMDQADKLEIAARTAKPEDAAKYRAQAQSLRQDAQITNAFTIKDKETRKEVTDKLGANQKLIDTIGYIKDALAKNPSGFDRDKWAELKTAYESAKADWIEAHHGKPSSREFEAIGDMFGADPSSFWNREAGRGKMESALNALNTFAIADGSTTLRAKGYKGQWRPRALDSQAAPVLSGQTSQDLGNDAELGAVSKHLSFTSNDDRNMDAENAAPLTDSGLAPNDESMVRTAMAKYASSNDAKQGDVVNQLAAWAQSPRQSVSSGVVSLIRENPEIYKAVLPKLPPDMQRQLKQFDDMQFQLRQRGGR